MKLTLIIIVSFALLITVAIPTATGRNRHQSGRKKLKISSPQKDIDTSSETGRASSSVNPAEENNSEDGVTSARSAKKGRRKKRPGRERTGESILKTSAKAKIVTERRYLKSDWCKSQPVRQHIRTKNNCHAVIINQFCYGQCNSFYIPKDIVVEDYQEELLPEYFKSCSICKPKIEEWISVRLRCKRGKGRRKQRFITKKVKRVKGCTCIAVPDLEKTSTQGVEDIAQSLGSATNSTFVSRKHAPNR